jgi:hypothetical protein
MANFSTYGMAGIGIAAAIGFVFALTVLNSSAPLDTSQTGSSKLSQRQSETQPEGPSSFFLEQDMRLADQQDRSQGSAAPLSKEQSADAGADSPQENALLQEESTELHPSISSVIAVNGTSGQVIGEIVPEMAFAIGEPVFIRVQLINPYESEIADHTIVLSVARSGDEEGPQKAGNGTLSYERVANFRGDIAANGSVALEMYWNPDQEGEYRLLLLSVTSYDLSDPDKIEPILSIPIKASEK